MIVTTCHTSVICHALLDCAGITNRLAVYKLQGLYLQSLYAYMKASRPGLSYCSTMYISDYNCHSYVAFSGHLLVDCSVVFICYRLRGKKIFVVVGSRPVGSNSRLEPTAGFITHSLQADPLETTISSAPYNWLRVWHTFTFIFTST